MFISCFYIRAQIEAQSMINNVLSVNLNCTAELHRSDSQQTLAIIAFALTYTRENSMIDVLFFVVGKEKSNLLEHYIVVWHNREIHRQEMLLYSIYHCHRHMYESYSPIVDNSLNMYYAKSIVML